MPTQRRPRTERAAAERSAAEGAVGGFEARSFRPPLWLRNPHLQTLWPPLFRRPPRVGLRKEWFDLPDGDTLSVHMGEGSPGPRQESAPLAVLLHGLEGTPERKYIRGQARLLLERGWGVRAIAFRGCDGGRSQARRLYHLGDTEDLELFVRHLIERWPRRPLFLSGFSLGGNVVAKWLGELGDGAPPEVRGAAITSPPFDPLISGPAIDRALCGFYTWRFLRTLIPKALAKERQYPGAIDADAVRRARTFRDFDTEATAALHGFEDADDYWRRCGCGRFLPAVRRPLLLIASRDDPFNPAAGLPGPEALENPWLYPCFSDRGGHVGFVHGPPWRPRFFAEEETVRFFEWLAACPSTPGRRARSACAESPLEGRQPADTTFVVGQFPTAQAPSTETPPSPEA